MIFYQNQQKSQFQIDEQSTSDSTKKHNQKLYQQKSKLISDETLMIQEFQKLLQTPKPTSQTYLKMMQDSMFNTMEELMPQNFDFGELAKLFEKQSENQNLASLTYELNQFFIRVISQNFISLQSYFALEQQTQKLQSTIRGHIKMEQEMKMYLEHLEYKIERYEHHLRKIKKHQNNQEMIDSSNQLKDLKEKDNIEHLKKRQTQLMKERLILLRKVDHMQRKLKDHESELRRLNSPTSATIQQIKQGMNRERRVSQIQQRVAEIGAENVITSITQVLKPCNEIDRRMSTNSFGSDHQITQKKTSMPVNSAYSNITYSLTGKDQNGSNLSLMQQLETRNNFSLQDKPINVEEKGAKNDNPYQYLNSPIDILIKVE